MADYDWRQDCGCPLMGPHRDFCLENPRLEFNKVVAQRRTMGFHYRSKSDAYECRRGCGTLVHDIEAHIRNVCPEWNPIAGES